MTGSEYKFYCSNDCREIMQQLIEANGGKIIMTSAGDGGTFGTWVSAITYQAHCKLGDKVNEDFRLYREARDAINGTA